MIICLIVVLVSLLSQIKHFNDESVCYLGIRDDEKLDHKVKFVPAYKYVQNRTNGIQRKIPLYLYQTHQNDYIPVRMSLAMSSILLKKS